MRNFILRSILAAASLGYVVYLFGTGHWGWAIVMIFVTAIIGLTFFRNIYMILALNQMRLGNTDKAKDQINKITAPHLLPKSQHAYVLFLQAVMNSQEFGFAKSEQILRKALGLGLRTAQDNAVAKMHLAGICAQTNRRNEATTLLAEAKKLDKNGMMKDQISQMQKQMAMGVPSKNQMRMAQMGGGRMKMSRR
jgi:hypothetical protein